MAQDDTNGGLVRLVVLVLGIVLLFPLLMMVFAMPMMGMMGWWMDGGMMGGFSPLWGVGMMVVWLLVLLGIGYVVYRALLGRVPRTDRIDPALQELRVAYARGELTEEEFEERRQKLEQE